MSGILPILRSKSSGWLHTFLNCMTKFIKFSILALLSTSLKRSCVEILLLILWYNSLCLCVIMQVWVNSVLGPISSSMSSFSLRSIKGFKTRCRRLNWCLLISPWSVRECDSMSFENHSWNYSWLSKSLGMIKWSKAHNSAIEFWIGVPVKSSRLRVLNSKSTFHLRLMLFLIAWASSKII